MSKRHSKKSKKPQTQHDPWPQVVEPYASGSALPPQRQPLLGPSRSQPLLQQGRSVPAGLFYTPGADGLHPGLPHQAPTGSVSVPDRAPPDTIASQSSSRGPGPPPTTVTAATVPSLHPQPHGRTLDAAVGGYRPLLPNPGPHHIPPSPGPYPLPSSPGPHHLSAGPGPRHLPASPGPGPHHLPASPGPGPHHLPASPGPLHIPPSPSPGPGSGGFVLPNQPPNRPELLHQVPRGNPDQDVMERYPPLLPGQNESLLPSHPLFRPELQQQIQKVPGYQAITSVKQKPQQGKKKKKGVVTKAEELGRISAKVEEIIEELSSKGKFLPGDVIRKVNMDLVNASNREHGLGIYWKDIEAYNHFSKLHGRIDELIKIYCMFTPITSLHELGLALAHAEKVSSFDELHMGPLVKHPRARDYFKPPEVAWSSYEVDR